MICLLFSYREKSTNWKALGSFTHSQPCARVGRERGLALQQAAGHSHLPHQSRRPASDLRHVMWSDGKQTGMTGTKTMGKAVRFSVVQMVLACFNNFFFFFFWS